MNIYFIAGASGSGKTAILSDLKKLLGQAFSVYDFDDIGVPDKADRKWRQESTEKWLQKLLQEDKDACLLGQMVLGEILACPSAKQINQVSFCLLDVSDYERVQRLKKRNTYGIDQTMLSWSAWLRMHHQDPQWVQHVLKENCWGELDFSVWDQLESWENIANVEILDTTELSINKVAESVSVWVHKKEIDGTEMIPNAPYKLYKNVKNALKIIDEKLFEHIKQCVPTNQKPEIVDKNYIIKENNVIIGSICSDIYYWNILYITVLFVNETHRHKGLAFEKLRGKR